MATPASPYAIVETGGKQYVVRPGSVLAVERLESPAGGEVALTRVLAVHDGRQFTVGRPVIAGAQVTCKVLAQMRGPKLISFKFKRRKGYHRTVGHRQSLTQLKVVQVTHGA